MAVEKATTTTSLKTEADPQPEDQGKAATMTLAGGTKVTAPKSVIDKLKARNA